MRHRVKPLILSLAALLASASPALSWDFGAVTSGAWNSSSTWTPASVPGATDQVFIGSNNNPVGSVLVVTVNLTQAQAVQNVILGDGSGTHGTLDLGASKLTVGGSFTIGQTSGAVGTVTRSTGSFSAGTLEVYNGNVFTFGSADTTAAFNALDSGTSVTTAATGNITGNAAVLNSAALTLGASLSLSGTLAVESGASVNAQNNNISAYNVEIGYYGSNAAANLTNRGNITATNLEVGIVPFTLTSTDTVSNFYVDKGATGHLGTAHVGSVYATDAGTTVDTTSVNNVSTNFQIINSASATLNAPLSVSGTVSAESGASINAQNNAITANVVELGYFGNSTAANLTNRGAITASYLQVGLIPFTLTSADAITNFQLDKGATGHLGTAQVASVNATDAGTTVDTTSVNNVTANLQLFNGAAATLNAPLSVTGTVSAESGASINAQNNAITASVVELGYYGNSTAANLTNRGAITATYLQVGLIPFTLTSADTVTNFQLDKGATGHLGTAQVASVNATDAGTTVDTTSANNITTNLQIYNGAAGTLNAPLSVTGTVSAESGASLNANGNKITANTIEVGYYGNTTPATVSTRGDFVATNVEIGLIPISLTASDLITNFYLNKGATGHLATGQVANVNADGAGTTFDTTSVNNITTGIQMTNGAVGTLGAALTLTSNVAVESGSILHGGSNTISANSVEVGYYGNSTPSSVDAGTVNATNSFLIGNGSTLTMSGVGGTIGSSITLQQAAALYYLQGGGLTTGFTLNGTVSTDLQILDTSVMHLHPGAGSAAGWLFRWKDGSSNWIATLNSLLSAGRITVDGATGYTVTDSGGYTYINFTSSAVPEPSSLALMFVAVPFAAYVRSRRRQVAPKS